MPRIQGSGTHGNEGLSGLVLLWNQGVFSGERPVRIFSQLEDAPLSPPLFWVDHWYSGLVTRTLAPFWRKEKAPVPPSFFFLPQAPPFEQGFAVLPYRQDQTENWSTRLYEILAGLALSPVVLDSESLSPRLKPAIPEVSKSLLDTREIRLYVSDPATHPPSFELLGGRG